jgi:uncharacterized membrane protein
MDRGLRADADLLQRALDGERVAQPEMATLVAVALAVSSVDSSGLAPRPEFVSELRDRLVTADLEALERWTGIATTPEPEPESRRSATILHLPRRPLRLVAAAAAAVVVIATALGFASRSALPGDLLYPVKQVLDRAAVQLSGSRFDQGMTHLAQAQQHISEARDLLDQPASDAEEVAQALDAASDSFVQADAILREVYRTEQRTEALTELSDFVGRAGPQVDAMDSRVPADARPAYQRLRDLLGGAGATLLQSLAQCADCGRVAEQARAILATSDRPTAEPTVPSGPGAATGTADGPEPAQSGPTSTTTPLVPRLTLPQSSVDLPGVQVPSASLSTGSIGVGGGGVGLPSATVGVPSVGVTSTNAVVGGGGVVLPGFTVKLPAITATVPLTTPTTPTTLPTLLPDLPKLLP